MRSIFGQGKEFNTRPNDSAVTAIPDFVVDSFCVSTRNCCVEELYSGSSYIFTDPGRALRATFRH